jgi:methionyl-tRNA formyltransferase
MRILFFGTPGFAVPSVRALVESGHEVVAVVTQPDRSTGRSRSVVVAPAVKVAAEALGIPVLQPDKPVGVQLIDQLSARWADLGVVVAPAVTSSAQSLAIPRPA